MLSPFNICLTTFSSSASMNPLASVSYWYLNKWTLLFTLCYIWPSGFDHTSSSRHYLVEDNLVRLAHQSFMNSTLESRGLSNRKSRRKFSSIGRSWASWGHSYLFEQFSVWGNIFLFWRISGRNRLLSTSRISIFPSLLSSYAWWQRPYIFIML